MATKTFSIVEKTTGPANPTANKIAGGNLSANTTYYYKLIANGTAPGGYYNDQNCWISAPSVEFSVTTDTTNKTAQIYWDNYTGQRHVGLYRSKVSGDYNQTNASGVWVKQYVPLTGYDDSMMRMLADTNANYFKVYNFVCTGNVTSLVPGETITEATSGATAIVVSSPAGTDTFKVRSITGTWAGGARTFSGSVSGANLGTWQSTSAQVGNCVLDNIGDSGLSYVPLFANGIPVIKWSGGDSADPITPQNVYDWLVAQGKTQYITMTPAFAQNANDFRNASGNPVGQYFCWMFNFMQDSAVTSYFKIAGNVTVYHLQGKFYSEANGTVQIGDYNTANDYTYNGGVYIGQKTSALYSGFLGPTYIYDSYVSGAVDPVNIPNNSWANWDSRFQWSSNAVWRLWDSVYRSTGRITSLFDIRRSRVQVGIGSNPELGATASTSMDKATLDTPVNSHYSQSEAFLTNPIMVATHTSRDIYLWNNYTSQNNVSNILHLINPTYPSVRTPIVRAVSTPIGDCPCDLMALEEWTANIKVVDTQGNPISGATIQVLDKNGKSQLITQTGSYTATAKIDKSGTSLTLGSGSPALTVGNVYRIGLERILVTAGSGTGPYTITRAYDDSTLNFIGSTVSYPRQMPHLVNPSLTSDANGDFPKFYINAKYWATYNKPDTTDIDLTGKDVSLNPMTFIISAPNKETYVKAMTVNGPISETIALEPLESELLEVTEIMPNVYEEV